MEFIDKFFIDPISNKIKYPEKIATALSGGCDSMALTLLMNEWSKKNSIQLTALIVDHKLRSESTFEANEVKRKMNNLNINCTILTYNGVIPSSNIEEVARNYRYNMIIDFCKKNRINFVATGHNNDEQCETFLLNLIRGSGVYGLCGIPEIVNKDGIIFIRPLLNYKKDYLKYICRYYGQEWVEDPSNDNEKYVRVKIRKMKEIFLSLGLSNNRICKTIDNMKSSREVIESYINLKLKDIIIKNYEKLKVIELDLNMLLSCPNEIAYRILRNIIIEISGDSKRHVRAEVICNLINSLKSSLKNKIFSDTMVGKTKLKVLNCNRKEVLQISRI